MPYADGSLLSFKGSDTCPTDLSRPCGHVNIFQNEGNGLVDAHIGRIDKNRFRKLQ